MSGNAHQRRKRQRAKIRFDSAEHVLQTRGIASCIDGIKRLYNNNSYFRELIMNDGEFIMVDYLPVTQYNKLVYKGN